MRLRPLWIVTLCALMAPLLGGCAGVVIGGAATGAAVIHDRRTAGTVIEDQNIELKALNVKNQDEGLRNHTTISATSYNLVVLLTGQAQNEQLHRRYLNQVRQIGSVKRVVDEVQIRPLLGFQDRAVDEGLAYKVKMALFGIDMEGFDPTRVKVTADSGVVYLMGIVTSREAEAAANKARFTNGVRKVVTLFEYL